jgi:hypothetical protein
MGRTTIRADPGILRTKNALVGSLALIGGILLAPGSANGLGIQASSPPVIDTGGPQVATYSATFTAGATEERFRVVVSPPSAIEGTYTMETVGTPTVVGSGGFSIYLSSPGPPSWTCSRIPGYERYGYPSSSVTADVELAAGGQITLGFPFKTGDLPLRPGDSLSPSMSFPSAVGEGVPFGPTFWPAPPRSGPSGVTFDLRTKPGGPASHFSDPTPPPFSQVNLVQNQPARIARGKPITVLGKTMPPLIRQKVDLIYTGPRRKQVATLDRVRTDWQGRFRLPGWRPKRLGLYEISAIYHSRLPDIRSDYAACSKLIWLVRAK